MVMPPLFSVGADRVILRLSHRRAGGARTLLCAGVLSCVGCTSNSVPPLPTQDVVGQVMQGGAACTGVQAMVTVDPASGIEWPGQHAMAPTDASGSFRFTNAPERYDLIVIREASSGDAPSISIATSLTRRDPSLMLDGSAKSEPYQGVILPQGIELEPDAQYIAALSGPAWEHHAYAGVAKRAAAAGLEWEASWHGGNSTTAWFWLVEMETDPVSGWPKRYPHAGAQFVRLIGGQRTFFTKPLAPSGSHDVTIHFEAPPAMSVTKWRVGLDFGEPGTFATVVEGDASDFGRPVTLPDFAYWRVEIEADGTDDHCRATRRGIANTESTVRVDCPEPARFLAPTGGERLSALNVPVRWEGADLVEIGIEPIHGADPRVKIVTAAHELDVGAITARARALGKGDHRLTLSALGGLNATDAWADAPVRRDASLRARGVVSVTLE